MKSLFTANFFVYSQIIGHFMNTTQLNGNLKKKKHLNLLKYPHIYTLTRTKCMQENFCSWILILLLVYSPYSSKKEVNSIKKLMCIIKSMPKFAFNVKCWVLYHVEMGQNSQPNLAYILILMLQQSYFYFIWV